MSKRKPKRGPDGSSDAGYENMTDAEEQPPNEDDQTPPDPPKSEEPRPKPQAVAPVISLADRKVTVDVFIRRKPGDLPRAFAVTLKSDEGIVKRTMSEWNTLYDGWLKAPRR